jgi:endonuclease I
MKKITSLLLILNIAIAFSQDGAPATPYYNSFNWTQTGTALKDALATKITNTHTNQLSYSEVWSALKLVDKDPANVANVFLVYGWETGADADATNDRTRDKNNNGGSNGQWNREHIFAQALGNPDLGQAGPGADAQMLRACDVQRNGSRANKLYTGGSGNSAPVGSNGWYPGDEWKGDVARIIMYMYLHYGDQCKPTFVTSGTTAPTDVNMVNLLLDWNAEDPVSPMEDYRNTYLGNASNTYGQGNRNPFIDNPYLATVIWGGPIAQNRWPAIFLASPTFNFENQVTLYPNPSADGNVTISSEVQLDEIEVTTINGQAIQQIKKPVLINSSYRISNLPQGFYFIKLNYNNQSITKKVIIN